MRRSRITGMALVAVFVMSVVAAPAFATSETNPYWKTEGAALTGSAVVTVAANGNQELISTLAETITCKKAEGLGAEIENASESGKPHGVDKESLKYTECTYGTAGTCKVSTKGKKTFGTIETQALQSELAYVTKAEAEKEEITETDTLTIFKPSGSVFVELEFEGSGCPILSNVTVEGSVSVRNTEEPLNESLTTHGLEAPATSIVAGFVNKAGKTEEVKTKLSAFGFKAVYIGKSTVALESGKGWRIGAQQCVYTPGKGHYKKENPTTHLCEEKVKEGETANYEED